MYTGWTAHLKEEEKDAFKGQIHRARHVLHRLADLIESELKAIDDTERDPKAYDNPAWAYKQAYKNGVRVGYNKIKDFIDIDRESNRQ